MTEPNKNTSIIKQESGAIKRVSKTLGITNKLLKKSNNIDLTSYKSVIIGTQEWMVENLNVDHFRNGDIIPEARTDEEWNEAGKNKQPAWCYYENDFENGKIYGKLYNWYAVNDSRNISPEGWHVPTDEEWKILTDYKSEKSVAGNILKEASFEHSDIPDEEAINSSCYRALPGGARGNIGGFSSIGNCGYWWASTEYSTICAWCIEYYLIKDAYILISYKVYGLSVRCVRDKLTI